MTEILTQPRVWIMLPEGSEDLGWRFPWDWSRWRQESRLIIDSDERTASSLGRAQFTMLRQTRRDPAGFGVGRTRFTKYTDQVVSGAWIAVTAGEPMTTNPASVNRPPILNPAAIRWWGYIASIDNTPVRGVRDSTGTVQALEVGHLLDGQTVQGAGERHPSDTYSYRQLRRPPTANMERQGGQIVGNAVLGKVATDDAREVYLFAPTLALCGTAPENLWTRWRLLRHLLLVARPKGLPNIEFPTGTAVDPSPDTTTVPGYLNDTTISEVLDIWEETYRGAFDQLLPQGHRLGWRIELPSSAADEDLNRWVFHAACTGSEAGFGLPSVSPIAINFNSGRDETLRFTDSSGEQPDEVAVEGGAIRFMVSVSYADSNLDRGWNVTQATAYDAATQEERSQPQFDDCYIRYQLNAAANNRLRLVETPGLASGGDLPMCQALQWDGTTLRLENEEVGYTPYLPSIALPSDLPWPIGLKGDGADARSAAAKASPGYLKPRLFYHLDGAWTDLLSPNALINETPSLSFDDNGAALRIAYRVAHALGGGSFAGADDGGEPGTLDWRNLVATLAIDSDQTVYVARRRLGIEGETAKITFSRLRRRLVVRDPRLQCWIAMKGSVLGVNDAEEAVRVTASNEPSGRGYVLRNDYPAAQRYCNRLAAWAFRSRQAATITLIRPDVPESWMQPLTVIGTVEDHTSEVVYDLYSAVRTVSRVWGDRPRITISTDLPPQPFAPGMAVSPVGGGPVSAQLGGTVPQAVRRLQEDVRNIRDRSRSREVISPRGGAGATTLRTLRIIGGNLAALAVEGIGYAETVTPAAVYDPDVTTVYPLGLGNAWLFIDGVRQPNRVLVRHEWIGDQTPLLSGRMVAVRSTGTLSFGGTDMTVYFMSWL